MRLHAEAGYAIAISITISPAIELPATCQAGLSVRTIALAKVSVRWLRQPHARMLEQATLLVLGWHLCPCCVAATLCRTSLL